MCTLDILWIGIKHEKSDFVKKKDHIKDAALR